MSDSHQPIENRVGAVFVPVSDVERSAEWYNTLLAVDGRPPEPNQTIYSVATDGETNVVLDATEPHVENSSQSLCYFTTPDADGAYEYASELNLDIVDDLEVHDDVTFFTVCDPDNNLVMVCQEHA